MSTALTTLTNKLAARFDMGASDGLVEILKATAFKGEAVVSDDQMTALLVVANQYGLNPWTREIYAFFDSRKGIVPVVGVDGWARIINDHKAFDGMDFEQSAEACTCIMYRKDRGHPVKITEYMQECVRTTGPWKSHPWRMLRHKAMIQCARIAFGFGGIYDEDEAQRIIEVTPTGERVEKAVDKPGLPAYGADRPNAEDLARLRKGVDKGADIEERRARAQAAIDTLQTKFTLTDAQRKAIMALADEKPAADVSDAEVKAKPAVTYAQLADKFKAAANEDTLNEAAALIAALPADQQADASALYDQRLQEIRK